MIDDEELATAPDYRWRRLWNQFWIHSCVVVFFLTAILASDFVIAAIVTAVFYFLVGRKVVEMDAAERGSGPGLSNAVLTSLERQRSEGSDTPSSPNDELPSGLPVTAKEELQSPPTHRQPATSFGRANPPSKKPVDLPRHRS